MDRTSRFGILICFVLLVGIEFTLDKMYPPHPPKAHLAVAPAAAGSPATVAETPEMTAAPGSPTSAPASSIPPVDEKFNVLENDALKLTFTSVGASIKEVELKQHQDDNGGHIVLNEQARSSIMALSGWPGVDTANFQLQHSSAMRLNYTYDLLDGLKWQRTYTFGSPPETDKGMSGYLRLFVKKVARSLGQPQTTPLVYTLDVNDTLTNPGTADVTLPAYSLSVGRAEPLYDPITKWSKTRTISSANSIYLGSGWLTQKFHLTTINDFGPSSFLWIFATRSARESFTSTDQDPAPLRWLGVENQFFAVLLTPKVDRSITHADFRCFNQRDESGTLVPRNAPPDIEAAAFFPSFSVPAGQSVTLNYSLYAGPKDFNRLDALGANQGEIMNYGLFELLIVPMLTVLHFWFLIFKNYGVAIILLTLMIKAITWPLQSFANRSGKRMQALAPKLKEMQALYKEQPEKLQKETFALYKDYGVNPFGGCVPALIQMPVFFSLYYMLQNAVELRGQSFLWVHDLTRPDTVWTAPFLFLGFHPALHPLPIMVTLLTMVMMRMTPQIGDPQQAKIAQFMPLIFLVIFYNFAAALSLYYVINNCVSIVQIYRNLRKPLPELKRVPKKKVPQK
jgi:YidC/Oxa1 family membrane protein insertase